MISPVVIAAALSFWAPYNGGQIPCAQGINIQEVLPSMITQEAQPGRTLYGYAYYGHSCNIYLNTKPFLRLPEKDQCFVISHEIGHAYFALRHSNDPTNVMYAAKENIPSNCLPRKRKAWER